MPKHASLMRKSSWSKRQNGAVQVNAFASCATRFLQLESHRNNPKIPWLMFLYQFTLNMLGNQYYEIPINHHPHHVMAIIFIYIYLEMLDKDGICKNTMDPDYNAQITWLMWIIPTTKIWWKIEWCGIGVFELISLCFFSCMPSVH